MSKPATVTRMVTHVKSTRDANKGRCGKRGGKHSRITTILAIVDCPDCRPATPSDYNHAAACALMAGVTVPFKDES